MEPLLACRRSRAACMYGERYSRNPAAMPSELIAVITMHIITSRVSPRGPPVPAEPDEPSAAPAPEFADPEASGEAAAVEADAGNALSDGTCVLLGPLIRGIVDEADDREFGDCVERAGSEVGAREVGVAEDGAEEGEAKP